MLLHGHVPLRGNAPGCLRFDRPRGRQRRRVGDCCRSAGATCDGPTCGDGKAFDWLWEGVIRTSSGQLAFDGASAHTGGGRRTFITIAPLVFLEDAFGRLVRFARLPGGTMAQDERRLDDALMEVAPVGSVADLGALHVPEDVVAVAVAPGAGRSRAVEEAVCGAGHLVDWEGGSRARRSAEFSVGDLPIWRAHRSCPSRGTA
jgi:hypothetical protein